MLAAAQGFHIRSRSALYQSEQPAPGTQDRCLSHCPGCCTPRHLKPCWASSSSLGLTDSTSTALAQGGAIPVFHKPLRSTAWQPLARELVKTHFQTATITPSYNSLLLLPSAHSSVSPCVQQQLCSHSPGLVSAAPLNQTWSCCLRAPPACPRWNEGASLCCQPPGLHPASSSSGLAILLSVSQSRRHRKILGPGTPAHEDPGHLCSVGRRWQECFSSLSRHRGLPQAQWVPRFLRSV